MPRTRLSLLLGLLALGPARADAATFYAYRATVSLPLQNATFVNNVDNLVTTKLSSKKLINAVRGQPLKAKVPSNLVVVLIVPQAGPPFTGTQLAVLDTNGNAVTAIATLTSVHILSPDDGSSPSAGVGQATVESTPQGAGSGAELYLETFTIAGGGTGRAVAGPDGPALSLMVSGLHAQFTRDPAPANPTLSYYAGVVTSGSVRVSGKPIATLDL